MRASVVVLVLLSSFAAVCVVAVPLGSGVDSAPLVVNTDAGTVKGGVDSRDGSRYSHGIPFAHPPVGDFRLRSPHPVPAWNGTRDCSNQRFPLEHICPQFISVKGKMMGKEDCLYLSVYTPNPMPAEPLPVMLWIYGGAFILGDSEEFDLYDGHVLAQQHNVIVVAPNYRLDSFGFLAHKALRDEDENGSTGNYAMLDQRAAMQWVQNNIAAFGGDPAKVTIFGESAGGFSVCWHIASPGSKGLFRAAIMESGSCTSHEFYLDADTALTFGSNWTKAAGCDDSVLSSSAFLACVRALPASELSKFNMAAKLRNGGLPPFYPLFPWGPMFDGNRYALPDYPINMINSGDFNKVPLLLGTNGDEGTIFTTATVVEAQVSPLMTDNDMKKAVYTFFNDTAAELIMKMYPSEGISNYPRLAHFLRDWFFTCPTRRVARSVSAANVPTFLYQFVYPKVELHRELGDYHAAELPYVFGSKLAKIFPIVHKEDLVLRDIIQTYWTNHAKNLNPNIGTTPSVQWPAYTRAEDTNLALNVPPTLKTGLEQGVCDFWDTIEPKY